MGRQIRDYDITSATHVKDYSIEFTFRCGKNGSVDFTRYLDRQPFSKLRDIEKFRNFTIEKGYIFWKDHDIDFSPETLFHEATGEPYPEWMDSNASFVAE